MTLTPAYGHDYGRAKDVIDAFQQGHDFIGDYSLGYRYVNKEQLPKGTLVQLRYGRLLKVTSTKA